jgi:hypothetical protein
MLPSTRVCTEGKIHNPGIKNLHKTVIRWIVTYDAESWTFTNKMVSLNNMAKENIEKYIKNNIWKWLLENKNE